jgi:hypothetical protein
VDHPGEALGRRLDVRHRDLVGTVDRELRSLGHAPEYGTA